MTLDPQVLAAEIPADVHQLHGVECRAAAPGRSGRMRALALEVVLDRHEPVAHAVAPADVHVGADVREDADVDVLEETGADVIRLRAEQLFGHARPQLQRALQVLLLHDLLDRERGRDLKRHAGVVSFAVARRAFDDRLVPRHTGLLRRLRDVVDVRSERDDRLAGAPRGRPRRRDPCEILLNQEAVLFEDAREVLRCLEFLKTGLGETEHRVVPLLNVFLHGVDFEADIALVLIELRIDLP